MASSPSFYPSVELDVVPSTNQPKGMRLGAVADSHTATGRIITAASNSHQRHDGIADVVAGG